MSKTIYDIARLSGVSVSTVSRVLNNNYPVSRETREKVERVVEAYGFTPNAIAKSLITKTTFNLGVVVPGITNLFFPSVVEEIQRNLADKGFIISLFTTEGNPEIEKSVINSIISRRMDGIFIIDPSVENLENGYLSGVSRSTPTILIHGKTDRTSLNFISYNEEAGTREALNYLKDLGHEEILFIRGDKSLSYDLREEIYEAFIEENGLKYSRVMFVGKGNTAGVVSETESRIRSWVFEGMDATAVLACNDLMAVGALNGLIKEGVRVPEDVSIIGFDNTLVSEISNPGLTTIDIDVKYIGEKAAQNMMNMIRNKVMKMDRVLFNTRLIYRESCGKRQRNPVTGYDN